MDMVFLYEGRKRRTEDGGEFLSSVLSLPSFRLSGGESAEFLERGDNITDRVG